MFIFMTSDLPNRDRVKSVHLLMSSLTVLRISGASLLSHKVLSIVMDRMSALINARPLTTISTDVSAPSLTTPAMILNQKVCSSLPPPGCFVDADLHRQQW